LKKPKKSGGDTRMKLKDIHEILDCELQDPEFAAIYLNDALNDGSPEEFLLALRNIIRATQGISQIGEETQLSKESLYKALSESGNPNFLTVYKIISALGLQILFEPSAS
jgi:probable addiction module antidote protein